MHGEPKLFQVLRNTLDSSKSKTISLGEIMLHLKNEGLVFLVLIVALPISIPIPTPPGFTTLFGIPLCLLTFQMIYKPNSVWLPKWLANKRIDIASFRHFVDKAEPWFLKATRFVKPRHPRFTTISFEKIVGVLALLSSIVIALPILFANAIPSISIVVMSVGLLYRDGITVLIGMIISMIGLLIAVAVVTVISFFGLEVLHKFIEYLSF